MRGVYIKSGIVVNGRLASQERNAFKPHCSHTKMIGEAFVVVVARCGGLGVCSRETALSREEVKQASSMSHSTWSTKDDLTILLRILSISTFIITSLINTCEWAFDVWISLHTSRVRTATDSRVSREITPSVGRGPFNPHVPGGFSFLRTREYWLPGAQISEHKRFNIRGVLQSVVIERRGLIFIHLGDEHWRRFDLAALATRGQEVECQQKLRRERKN